MCNDRKVVVVNDDDFQTLLDIFGEQLLDLVVEPELPEEPDDSTLH
jgi:hypothetical protein